MIKIECNDCKKELKPHCYDGFSIKEYTAEGVTGITILQAIESKGYNTHFCKKCMGKFFKRLISAYCSPKRKRITI